MSSPRPPVVGKPAGGPNPQRTGAVPLRRMWASLMGAVGDSPDVLTGAPPSPQKATGAPRPTIATTDLPPGIGSTASLPGRPPPDGQ